MAPGPHCSVEEQVVWCLARQIRPGDVLVVGVGTPIAVAAGLLARELLVDDLVVIEAAAVDPEPHDLAESMADPELLPRSSVGVLSQAEVLDAIQRGRVTLQFVSPAQVDGDGALNTSRVRGRDGGVRHLPGGLATADVTVLVGRLVVYRLAHSPRFLVDEVDFMNGAPGRVETIVTSRAVIERGAGGFRLASVHRGEGVEEVREACGFPLEPSEPVPVTEPPPPEALTLLRERIDLHQMRRLESREGREAALRALSELS